GVVMEVAAIVLVIVLCLYTFVPARLRAQVGPGVHAVAEAIRALLRPVVGTLGAFMCWLFGVKRSPSARADYVQQPAPAPALFDDDDPAFPPLPETETKAFPGVSHAGKQPGNATSVSDAAQYAETLLLERLA